MSKVYTVTLDRPESKNYERKKYEKIWSGSDYRQANSGDKRYPQVAHHLRSVGAKRVIDLGVGRGVMAQMLSDEFDVTGFDIADNCLDEGVTINFIQGCLWDDLDIGTYDAVICTDVLEHIPPPFVEKAVDNIGMLAPHGYLVIATHPEVLRFDEPLHLTVRDVEWWNKKIPYAEVNARLTGGAIAKY